MFTGIVTAIGTVASVERRGDLRVVIACPYDPAQIAIGASIACSGVCLTVVDRLLIYRAPIVIGGGLPGVADLGLTNLSGAHGRWHHSDSRRLGNDTLEVYERTLCSPA